MSHFPGFSYESVYPPLRLNTVDNDIFPIPLVNPDLNMFTHT